MKVRKDIDKYQTQIINDENRKQSYGIFSKSENFQLHWTLFEKGERDPEYKKSISNHQMFREIEGTFINYEK